MGGLGALAASLLVVVVVVGVVVGTAGTGSGARSTEQPARSAHASLAASARTGAAAEPLAAGARSARGAATPAAGSAVRRHRRSPGSLPQTHQFPSSSTAQFRAQVGALWRAITTDNWRAAVPAFFPKGAYLQLKAIAGAGEDFDTRLLGGYRLDIRAAHALLGADAFQARLMAVRVPSNYGHWVEPGVCYNRIGYYEVPNSRLVYSDRGAIRSFGIASMISWRGVWYVVHLGSVLRPVERGYVDAPATGPGVSEYSGTC
jgi:hypothetical protein